MNSSFLIKDFEADENIHISKSKPSMDVLLKCNSSIDNTGSLEVLNECVPHEELSSRISHEERKQSLFGFPIVKFRNNEDFNEGYIDETESQSEKTICIPPWAQTLRKSQDDACKKSSEESTESIRLKIKNIMKNYSDAMLVKRVENQEQLILEPSTDNKKLETIKRSKTNTRYYLAPLHKSDEHIFKISSDNNIGSPAAYKPGRNLSDISMVSKAHAKKEVSNVIKSLKIKSDGNKRNVINDKSPVGTKRKVSCPKISVGQIRSYVENKMLDSNERQLHEMIKVKTVPSKTTLAEQNHGRQYTINIPKGNLNNINVVKIKEKRKLQINRDEETNEEGRQSESKPQAKGVNDYTSVKYSSKPDKIIKKIEKSPMETRVFEVKTLQTPIVAPIIEENKGNKVLLIEHEINYKPKDKGAGIPATNLKKTQLLGIKQRCAELQDEIYLYDTETSGKHIKENLNKIEVVSPSLKQKVNSIFEELKEITFRQKTPEQIQTSKVHVSSGTNTEDNQYFQSNMADITTKPILHDVRSAAIQVRQSELLQKISSKEMPSKYSIPSLSKEFKVPKKVSKLQSRDNLISSKDTKLLLKQKSISDTSGKRVTIYSETPGIHHLLSKDQVKLRTSRMSEVTSSIGKINVTDTIRGSLKSTTQSQLLTEQDNQELLKDENVNPDLKKEETNEKTLDINEETETYKVKEESINEQNQEEGIILNEDDKEQLQDNYADKVAEQQADKVAEQQADKVAEQQADEVAEQKADKFDHAPQQAKDDHELPKDNETPLSKQSHIKTQSSVTVKSTKDELKVLSPPTESPSIPGQESFLLPKLGSDDGLMIKSYKEIEDIRSYEIDPQQEKELKFKSDSKFIRNKEMIRKKMNWTENTIYLENNMCPQIIRALAETAMRTPAEPVNYLANWIYKDYQNNIKEEEKSVFQEHLNLARSMKEITENRERVMDMLSLNLKNATST